MKLRLNYLDAADQVRNVWRIRPEVGVTLENIIEPDYWANVANRMTVGDEISVFAKDGSYFAELLVQAVSERSTGNTVRAQWAKVFVIRHIQIAEAKEIKFDEEKYDIKWRAAAKYSVIRKSDKAILQDGFASKNDAATWVNNYKDALAA